MCREFFDKGFLEAQMRKATVLPGCVVCARGSEPTAFFTDIGEADGVAGIEGSAA